MIKKGDKVKVVHYSREFNGEFGVVARIDGFYVYVFLDCQPDNDRYPVELLAHEVELVK